MPADARRGLLREADKKNVLISSCILLALAILFFVMINNLLNSSTYPWLFLIPTLYLIASILGMLGGYYENTDRILLYQISVWCLIVMNGAIVVSAIIFGYYVWQTPNICDTEPNENCGLIGFGYFIAYFMSISSLVISSAIIGMLIVFLRIAREFKENKINRTYS